MPPQTRRTKITKASKENIGVITKAKSKTVRKNTKSRKALTDKTNSASDDNSSEISKKDTSVVKKNKVVDLVSESQSRPRRERRLPNRYNENVLLVNLSKNKNISDSTLIQDVENKTTKSNKKYQDTKNNSSSIKSKSPVSSPLKIPQKEVEESLISKRPKRVCRLPSKFDDRSLSPNKFIPVACRASFRVLEDKEKPMKRDNSHLDVYEFTYDPNEEPPPQKKKRKRVAKKPPKPKRVVWKNYYDQNLSKTLTALKIAVSKKPTKTQIDKSTESQSKMASKPTVLTTSKPAIVIPSAPTESTSNKIPIEAVSNDPTQQAQCLTSTRVEDIEADFEPLMAHNDIDYSPVASSNRGKSPVINSRDDIQQTNHQDPLNLQDNLSFFDDVPVASSSMNTSVRPDASPWRVDFNKLPIKWHINNYIKPNMTPAVESSIINFDNSNKKKHVYTNLVPELNDALQALPEIVTKEQPNLKQTSIISFIKEVVERSAGKKKRALSVTPTKANSIFGDVSNMSVATNRDVYRTPNKTPRREAPDIHKTPNKAQEENILNAASANKDNSSGSGKCAKKGQKSKPAQKDNNLTFFGFDESEDQENVSPVKIDNPRARALRPRARAVLKEINSQSGPTRAKVPLAAKTNIVASSDAINKVFEEIKSATDAPQFLEKDNGPNTDVNDHASCQDEDSQSVHLFEDIELVHHVKPWRKSYGKAKKVTLEQTEVPDSDTQSLDAPPQEEDLSEEEYDDLVDLHFTMQNVGKKNIVKKKPNKKNKQLLKKEKAEMEAWADQFNSMCEDVEEFPLVVE